MNDKDGVFKALADPTRREILAMLRKNDSVPGEMISHFNITKPSLSHHLDILKKARLVLVERKGQKLVYSLNVTVFDEVLMFITGLFGKKEKNRRKYNVQNRMEK
jgi:ArsR family transcriptional regulator